MNTVINYNTEIGDFTTRMSDASKIEVNYSIPGNPFKLSFTACTAPLGHISMHFAVIYVSICEDQPIGGADVWLANRAIQFAHTDILEQAFKDHAKIQITAAS